MNASTPPADPNKYVRSGKSFDMSPARIWTLMTPAERQLQLLVYTDGNQIDPTTEWDALPYWFTHAWGWSVEFAR